MEISDKNIKYAVIGDPIAHSLSPQMQNAGFEACGLGRPYGKIHVRLEELNDFTAFARDHLLGFNITVPHKQNIIPYLDSISEAAGLAKSVNTVTVIDGKLHGDTTDGYGLQAALKSDFDLDVEGASLFFVGCGGAIQAVAYHLAAQHPAAMYFANRTAPKAGLLVAGLGAAYPEVCYECCALDEMELLQDFISKSDVLIQGTSLGLKPEDPSPIPLNLLKDICVYDTIYKETPLQQAARKAELPVADGRSMLLFQGAKSFNIWTGMEAPVAAMRQALETAIAQR
ncbi:shikimate dehydrogenase [Lentisphaerota bacterium ZTH]|nr:shikimate dehydrogenase [Lentisphaerota bacterium]WET07094.1 shikimate dehydrogenase [Lentisphaerota bacterium ZTH]